MTKARGALVYPSFIILTFVIVMVLMFTLVIPKISTILVESGQQVPFYTRIVLGISNALFITASSFLQCSSSEDSFLVRFIRTPSGRLAFDRFKISIPYVSTFSASSTFRALLTT
jgi:type II secretory pathway component PulF